MNKTEDPNYSQKAKQIGENVIKKSKAAENYTQTGIQYLEVFISKLFVHIQLEPAHVWDFWFFF